MWFLSQTFPLRFLSHQYKPSSLERPRRFLMSNIMTSHLNSCFPASLAHCLPGMLASWVLWETSSHAVAEVCFPFTKPFSQRDSLSHSLQVLLLYHLPGDIFPGSLQTILLHTLAPFCSLALFCPIEVRKQHHSHLTLLHGDMDIEVQLRPKSCPMGGLHTTGHCSKGCR